MMPMLYGISWSNTTLTEASQHLLKRQGKKLKRHGAVTLGRFGGNPDYLLVTLLVGPNVRNEAIIVELKSYLF